MLTRNLLSSSFSCAIVLLYVVLLNTNRATKAADGFQISIVQEGSQQRCIALSGRRPYVAQNNSSTGKRSTSIRPLYVLPELSGLLGLSEVDATIAVVSAVAGAAAQMPRLAALEEEKKALEKELATAKAALTESEAKLVERVNELETALFEIDREYEGQTERMKQKFDKQLKDELETLKTRLKTQYARQTERLKDAYEKDTELQKEELGGKLRQEFLQEKLSYIQEMSGNKRDELSNILQEQANIQKANVDLEQALAASRKELEQMQAMAKQKGWWPFGRR